MNIAIKSTNLKKDLNLPESWNDLPVEKQLAAYQILFSDSPIDTPPEEVIPLKKVLLFMLLTDLPEEFVNDWQSDCIQSAESEEEGELIFLAELDECLRSTNLFFRNTQNPKLKTQNSLEVNYGLTKCPWPELGGIPSGFKASIKKTTWLAPAFDEESGDGLSNISLYELANTFTLFERMVTEENPHQKEMLIHRLLATIYRPAKPATEENIEQGYNGDQRQPLIGYETMIKTRQPLWQHIPKQARQLLVFWFASCRRHIIEQYPLVFKPPKGEQSQGNDFGWGGVLLELAGGLPHLQEVYAQPYQNGLIYLSRLEDQRMRQEMEAKKRKVKKLV